MTHQASCGSLGPSSGRDGRVPPVGFRKRVGDTADKRRSSHRRGWLLGANSIALGKGTKAWCLRSCRACCPRKLDTLERSRHLHASYADNAERRGRTRHVCQGMKPPHHLLTKSGLSIRIAARSLFVEGRGCVAEGTRMLCSCLHIVPRFTSLVNSEIIRQISEFLNCRPAFHADRRSVRGCASTA